LRLNGRVVAGVAAVLLAVGVWVVATRGRSQPPTGASAVDALVAATVPKVEHAVGLRFKRPPRVEVRSREQVRQFLETQFNDPRQQRDIAGTSTALKLLGLIPDTLDLRHEEEALFTEQIAGFYDPKTKVLYWIAGEDTTAMLDEVIPHELVHALQDQYVNLDSIENAEGNDDRTMAAQAVFEGQAFYEQLAIAEPGVSLANQLPGLYGKIREAIRENRAKMPQYTAAPMVVQEVTIFPYLSGIEFVRRYEVHHPGGVPFDALPVSTQQVLHEDAYFGTPQALPVAVTLPPPRTGTVAYVNTMGEFQTRLFLFQHLDDQNASVRGAAAWVGDRYEVIDLKDGPALVWVTLLDSPVDAAQFVDLLDQTAHNRFGAPTSLHVYTKGARTVTITPVAVGGHPGVLYTDAPAASDLPLLDPATITTP
jgi:hypothetical protein